MTTDLDVRIAEALRSALAHPSVRAPIRVTVADNSALALAGQIDAFGGCDRHARIGGARWVTNNVASLCDVCGAIQLPTHPSDHVDVVIESDTVVLGGSVHSWLERRAIRAAVRGAIGMKRLDDRMTVLSVATLDRTGYCH
jgi:hypothetical protein